MKKRTYIYIAALTLILWRCTEPYTPNLDSTFTRLAIEGYITDDTAKHYIKLTYSSDYLANKPAVPVNGAMVYVYVYADTANLPIDTLNYVENNNSGKYLPLSGRKGIPGLFYELHVENVDINKDGQLETYHARDYMPFPIGDNDIDSVSLNYLSVPQFDTWQFKLWAHEPLGPNWYVFNKWKNGKQLSDSIDRWNVTNDFLIDGNYTSGVDVQNIDNHDSIEWPELMDTFTLEMWNISEAFYTNIIQTQQVIGYQNPLFSGPPANVFTNVSDGAIGFFACYSTNYQSTIIKYIPQEALDRRAVGQ